MNNFLNSFSSEKCVENTYFTLINLDQNNLYYHLLQYNPIWGYKIIVANQHISWISIISKYLDDSNRINLEEDDIEWLFLVGRAKNISIETFLDAFAQVIATELLIKQKGWFQNDYKQIILLYKSKLIQKIATSEMLNALQNCFTKALAISDIEIVDTDFPTESTLKNHIENQVCRLPSDLRLTVVSLNNGRLSLENQTLLSSTSLPKLTEKHLSFTANSILYMPPGEQSVQIVLRSSDAWLVEEFVYFSLITTLNSYFEITVELTEGKLIPEIRFTGINKNEIYSNEISALSLPTLEHYLEEHQVMLIIDASMSEKDKFKDFAGKIIEDLNNSNLDVKFGYVVYGHYENSNHLTTLLKKPVKVTSSGEFLDSIPFTSFKKRKFSLALELGLQSLNRELDRWLTKDCSIILIGSSPPHPTPRELKDFSIIETPTDFYKNIKWEDELQFLINQAKLRNSNMLRFSVWVEPNFPITSEQRSFANHVWSAFGEHHLHGLNEQSILTICETIKSQHTAQTKYRLSAPIRLPLKESLDSIIVTI